MSKHRGETGTISRYFATNFYSPPPGSPIVVWGFSKFKKDDFDQRKLFNGSQGPNFAF
jgi:hypothetical protein